MSEFNWSLLVIVLLIAGVIAFIGDNIGMKISRKRPSIFGLRPKYTTSFITVVTGIAIALSIVLILSYTSPTVNTALFGIKRLQRLLSSLSKEVEVKTKILERKSKELLEAEAQEKALNKQILELKEQRKKLVADISELKEVTKRLQEGLSWVREGKIIFSTNELIFQAVLKGSSDPKVVQKELVSFLKRAGKIAYVRGARPFKGATQVAFVLRDEFERAVKKMLKDGQMFGVRFIALRNTVKGEPVIGRFEIFPNKLIFKKREVILSRRVDGRLSRVKIEQELFSILKEVNKMGVKEGIVPDPYKHTVGSILASSFYETVSGIKAINGYAQVDVLTLRDIYSIGPLMVEFKVKKVNE
ncbi:MAG: DUF3084 domain-containing protein [Synergistetes bacterium]|nr:DUF3084 domain-containing protein [Synergistota bacterium]